VIDDGSTDDTKNIVANFKTIRYYFQEKSGTARAKNRGILLSKGKYFLTLDADDILHPKYIERCLVEIKKKDNVAFVWTATQEFGIRNRALSPRILHHRFSIYKTAGGQLGAALWKKSVYCKLNGIDETLSGFEDWDLAIRAYLYGWKGVPIFETLHYYRIHSAQQVNAMAEANNSKLELYKKYPLMKRYIQFYNLLNRMFRMENIKPPIKIIPQEWNERELEKNGVGTRNDNR
jgi:glycosyltransferase involved in cell wall biosynthesis